jgi:putative two-component system response regulator
MNQARAATIRTERPHTSTRVYQAMLSTLAAGAETRDPASGDHLNRIRLYSRCITHELLRHRDRYRPISRQTASLIEDASVLHDIGKTTIPDSILLKPGRLTQTEFGIVREHTVAGHRMLDRLVRQLGPHPFLMVARDIAHSHHEHWDGNGYPQGLSGEHIPLAARIVAIADVFDALVSRRCYKPAIPLRHARRIVERGAGTQFDPRIVRAFKASSEKIFAVARRWTDRGGELHLSANPRVPATRRPVFKMWVRKKWKTEGRAGTTPTPSPTARGK